jgi:predicted esterase
MVGIVKLKSVLKILILVISILFITSCTQKNDFSGVQIGKWYIYDDMNIAIRFNNIDGDVYGDYIITSNCYSDLYQFSCVKSRKKIEFNFKSHLDIQLNGVLDSDEMGFAVKTSKNSVRQFVMEQNIAYKGNKRYLEPMFDDVTVTEVIYGKAPGFYSSKPVSKATTDKYPEIIADVLKGISNNVWCDEIELTMDVYQPTGDELRNRPLFLLIHGGAFIVGDKRDEFNVRLAEYYARCGYVVASINYRMGFVFIPGVYSALERAMYRATQDARAALRFLSDNQNRYGINPKYCFVGGNSAGGFISLFTAFMEEHQKMQSSRGNLLLLQRDLGCLDCSGNTNKGSFNIRGVVNMWGAITDLGMIDFYEKIPVLLIHGDEDYIVPFYYDYPFSKVSAELASVFTQRVFGSKPIYDKMRYHSMEVELYRLFGEGHEPYEDDNLVYNENYDKIKDRILNFFSRNLKNVDFVITKLNENNKCRYQVASENKVHWHAEGGVIVKNRSNEVQVVWLNGYGKRKISAFAENDMGYVNTDLIELD